MFSWLQGDPWSRRSLLGDWRRSGRTVSGLLLLTLGLLAGPVVADAAPKMTAINLETTPPGAEVTLLEPAPEKLLGVTPLKKVKVPQGPIKLRLRLAGYEDKVELLTIGATAVTFNYQLVRTIQPGTFDLSAGDAPSAGAEVVVDGELKGVLPVKVPASPGRHQIVVRKAGFVTWEKWADVAENQLASYEVTLRAQDKPKGSLFVSSAPVGADVKLNGAPKGKAPLALDDLDPGTYQLDLTLEGHSPVSQQVTIKEGARETVAGTLQPLAAASGELKVLCDAPGGTILVDGEEKGPAPLTLSDVKPGDHVVECRASGYPPASSTVPVVAGQVKTVALGPRVAVAAQRGSVSVVSDVPGALAQLNGGAWEKTPAQFSDLAPGKYQVVVRADGRASFSDTVTVAAQQVTDVKASLASMGKLQVKTPGGKKASVYVDGAIAGEAPTTLDLPVGPHKVLIKAAGAADETYDVAVLAGQTATVQAKLAVPTEPRIVRRSNPTSAHVQEPGKGSVQVGVGVPALFEATISAGVIPDFELGLQMRNTLHVITEFELQGQYQLLGTRAFAVGIEAGIGGGLGGSDRNAFTFQVKPVASLLLGDSSSFSLYGQFRFFSDTISQELADERSGSDRGDTSASGFWLPLGLQGEFMLRESLNLWLRAELNVASSDDGRLLYEDDMADFLNGRYHFGVGLTWLFN